MYSLMYKMVIIDDNRRELRYVQGALEWENYQIDVVGTFYNPLLALEEIPKLLPDIILTDIVMPQINGFQLVAKALEYNPRRWDILPSPSPAYTLSSQSRCRLCRRRHFR